MRAQAIASRTYAYYQINIYGTLNNSNQFQVYIPYRYDALSAAPKAVIDQAIAGQPYMSLPGSTEPIAAFFSDNTGVWTDPGSESYLKSVYDPISRQEGWDNPNHEYGGMGQKAAGRWGAGRTNEYPGGGASWSVRWDTAQQILAHYYTGINFIGLTPDPPDTYRFNILQIEGLPEQISLRAGESISGLNVYFQNSGPADWPVFAYWPGGGCPTGGHPTRLSYHLYTADNNALACASCFAIELYGLCQANSDVLQPGTYAWIPNVHLRIPSEVAPGTYKLRFDLEVVNPSYGWASGLPGANHWPTQDIEVTVEAPSGGGEPSVNINHPPAVFTTDYWRTYGQRFGFTWTPLNGADYFDFRYRSREFYSAGDWDSIGWTQTLDNVPYTSVSDSVGCSPLNHIQDRREYQFQVRGQIGPDGDEGSWRTTYSSVKVFPFLSISNVAYGYAFFFESEAPTTTRTANLSVTNAGGGTLQWQVTDNRTWMELTPASGTDDGTVTLSVTKPGGVATYTGQITFTVTGGDPTPCNSQILIPVTVYVVDNLQEIYLPIIFKQTTP